MFHTKNIILVIRLLVSFLVNVRISKRFSINNSEYQKELD